MLTSSTVPQINSAADSVAAFNEYRLVSAPDCLQNRIFGIDESMHRLSFSRFRWPHKYDLLPHWICKHKISTVEITLGATHRFLRTFDSGVIFLGAVRGNNLIQ